MKRALAMFAKTPMAGFVKTRLTPPLSPQQAADLYRCMFLDTVARARTLAADPFICYDGDHLFFTETVPELPLFLQEGDSLGTRLEAAFDRLTSLGYRARVVIGTDAPDLPLSYIEESFRLLEEGSDVVFGPAEDGGYYLVGLSCAHGELFRDIPWSGPDVLERSLERASQAGLRVALLPVWYDVDCYDDLSRPGLCDPENGAQFTRAFLAAL
jgi:rSAM/selenodomain-associated transferase 1